MVRECMSAVILCGGRSSRMDGFPKQSLIFQGRSFLEILLEELEGFGQVALSANRDDVGSVRSVWRDIFPGCGPMGGIHAALSYAAYDWVFVVACDMPRMSRDCMDVIVGQVGDAADCVIPVSEGRIHPLCGAYHRRLLPLIGSMLDQGDYRLRSLISRARSRYVEMPDRYAGCFYNVNTPELFRKL